ncbi:MAG: FG-GAP-like repeat-containing protein, partial [Gemmataceae bacterium]
DSVFNLQPTIQTFTFSHVYVANGDYIADTKITPLGGPGTPLESHSEVIVSSAPPSVVIVNLPAKPIPEGVPYTLSASASETGNPGQTFSYVWSMTKNGLPFATGTGGSFTFTPDDQGSYKATVKATDSFGVSVSATSPVITAFNVAPTASLINDSPKPVGGTVTFSWVNQHDAAADLAAGFTYSYDFNGDGTFDLVTTSPTATFAYTAPGIYSAHGRITDKDGAFSDVTSKVSVGLGGNGGIVTTRYVVTGADAGGGPAVRVYTTDGTLKYSFFALNPRFTGGVRVAVGDVNGDGIEDIIAAAGPGGGPQVQVFDGKTGALLRSFFAYNLGFTGGVYVASGDVNGDGFADIVTGVGGGGGPHVEVFSGADGSLLQSFFAYNPAVTTGVSVAAGDVDGDGKADIVTGAGPGGAPHVQVFRGTDLSVLRSFFAGPTTFTGGVYVAAGDLNGDGIADIAVGLGASATATDQSRLRVYNGATQALLYDFAPYGSFHGGVRVAVEDLDGDGKADLIVSPGTGHNSNVLGLKGTNLMQLLNFNAYDPAFLGGVFVG